MLAHQLDGARAVIHWKRTSSSPSMDTSLASMSSNPALVCSISFLSAS